MRRYWRIYRTFFVSSFTRELEFRANFFAKILQNLVWILFFLLIVLVIYANTDSVAGWSRGETFVLMATCIVLSAVTSGFFLSLHDIPEQVRRGTLDFVITKPVDTQFWVSTRRFNFDQIGTLLAGFALAGVGAYQAGLTPSFAQWIGYLTLALAAVVIFYSLNLFLMTLGIWLVRVDNLWVLADTVIEVSRFPIDIYGPRLSSVFTFALPLAFIATIPTRQLIESPQPAMIALGLGWALAAFLIARWFWRFALRHYTSASG